MSTLPDGILQTQNGHFVLEHDSHLSRWVEQQGRLDVQHGEVMQHFAKYIPAGGTVVNAGASLGDHACIFADLVGSHGKVFAFEPNRLPFECLRRNMAMFPQVHCFNLALGDLRGGAEFMRDANAGASHIRSQAFEAPELNPTMVHVAPLDDCLLEIDRLDMIFLDAEGFEISILCGAVKTIRRFKPAIVLEICHGHMRRYGSGEAMLRTIVTGLGYAIHEVDGTPQSEQRDVLCLPA